MCEGAQLAIEILDTSKVDLILLDIMLPGGNGLAFLQELRSFDDTRHVPVLIISGTDFSPEQRRALQQFAPIFSLEKIKLTPESLITAVEEASGIVSKPEPKNE